TFNLQVEAEYSISDLNRIQTALNRPETTDQVQWPLCLRPEGFCGTVVCDADGKAISPQHTRSPTCVRSGRYRDLFAGTSARGQRTAALGGRGIGSAGCAPGHRYPVREGDGSEGDAHVWFVRELLRADSKWGSV